MIYYRYGKTIELTPREKEEMLYRAEIVRMLYGIGNVAVLNYIRIIISDIAQDTESGVQASDERKEVIAEFLKEIEDIRNIA